jgi:antitoxin MazE
MPPKSQLAQWGNSLAIRIPKPVAVAAKLKRGDHVKFKVAGPGTVQIRAAEPKRSLSQLVRAITPENCHAESDWAEPVSRELL